MPASMQIAINRRYDNVISFLLGIATPYLLSIMAPETSRFASRQPLVGCSTIQTKLKRCLETGSDLDPTLMDFEGDKNGCFLERAARPTGTRKGLFRGRWLPVQLGYYFRSPTAVCKPGSPSSLKTRGSRPPNFWLGFWPASSVASSVKF